MLDIALDAQIRAGFNLPHIPLNKRIIPNDMIRSSLFTISNHNQRRDYLNNKKLYSFKSTEIIYTGEELRQDDEDIWLQLVYMAAEKQTEKVEITPYTFIGQVGWPKRTQYKDRLKNSLTRMSATTLKLYNREFEQGIGFSLIRKFEWCDNGKNLKNWKVWLEPEVVNLFASIGKMYSKVNWHQRKKLKPLAKWLHAFYSSHAEPEPTHVLRLKDLSGSKTKTYKHFKVMLRDSLLELAKIGFIELDFYIDPESYVSVKRVDLKYKQVSHENT